MPPQYVTANGLEIPSVQDLQTSIAADQRANVDPLINTEPDSPQGNINGIFSSHLREAWEVVKLAFDGLDPDEAEGTLLEDVSALTGTTREGATASTLAGTRRATVNLNAFTPLPIGTVFSVAGNPAIRFETTEAIDGATVLVTGDYPVAAKCQTLGPVACNAGTLTVIATPVSGLNSVTNAFDAVLGASEDEDPGLRARRERELRATGSATVDAIRADILAYKDESGNEPFLSCTVFENETDAFDANGLPPHSLEVLVFDGVAAPVSNDVIAQLIWNTKGGGIQTIGTSSGNAIDGLGKTRVVQFSRPTIKQTKFAITLAIKATQYAGDVAAKQAVVDRFILMAVPGQDIRFSDYISALVYDVGRGLAGVVDVTNLQLGVVGSGLQATFTNLSVAAREVGAINSSDITITTVAV